MSFSSSRISTSEFLLLRKGFGFPPMPWPSVVSLTFDVVELVFISSSFFNISSIVVNFPSNLSLLEVDGNYYLWEQKRGLLVWTEEEDHLSTVGSLLFRSTAVIDLDIPFDHPGSNLTPWAEPQPSDLRCDKEKGKGEVGTDEAKDDEDDTADSTHHLLEQLSQKDEQIQRMEKKLEEMMSLISMMQGNNPPVPETLVRSSPNESEPLRARNPIQVDSVACDREKYKAPIIDPKEVQVDQALPVPKKEQKNEAELSSDKLVISTNCEHMSLKPLTLYDFYFVPPGTKKEMKMDYAYIMFVSANEYTEQNPNNNENNSQIVNANKVNEQFQYYYDSDSPILIIEETDSDEDRVQVTREDNSDLSTMERLKRYVENITLTPLSHNDVKRLEVKAYLPLNPETKANNFIPYTSKPPETDVTLTDPFMDDIIDLPYDWYSNAANRFAKQALSYPGLPGGVGLGYPRASSWSELQFLLGRVEDKKECWVQVYYAAVFQSWRNQNDIKHGKRHCSLTILASNVLAVLTLRCRYGHRPGRSVQINEDRPEHSPECTTGRLKISLIVQADLTIVLADQFNSEENRPDNSPEYGLADIDRPEVA
ncbi:hypothetical protein MA16_Dca021006 [Dendrobium catenatum]|uniref:Uncharacterized protein n=1 Tax=Dendrobium catenatum TaxID=906689 RepID=A0A2I0VZJ4_9ASPA|nr:hypothetical protein MA16_Dca021006 [Dendrobium catenatum]